MNISKGKVLKNREWSASTQKKLASMLGVSAMLSAAALTACDFGTTSGDVTGPELSSSSENLPPESGVVEPPEPTCGEMPCDGEYPPEISSSSQEQPLMSSSSSQPSMPFSSSDYPPLAGIVAPSSSSIDFRPHSSSSYAIDTLEITSGEIAPPDTLEPVSSSSSTLEVEIDTTLTAGLPVIEESSSSEEFYVPAGDPVLPEDPIYIDDPKD